MKNIERKLVCGFLWSSPWTFEININSNTIINWFVLYRIFFHWFQQMLKRTKRLLCICPECLTAFWDAAVLRFYDAHHHITFSHFWYQRGTAPLVKYAASGANPARYQIVTLIFRFFTYPVWVSIIKNPWMPSFCFNNIGKNTKITWNEMRANMAKD